MLQHGSPPSATTTTNTGGHHSHQILQTSTGQQIIVLNQPNAQSNAQVHIKAVFLDLTREQPSAQKKLSGLILGQYI